jgi:hypothetical protein
MMPVTRYRNVTKKDGWRDTVANCRKEKKKTISTILPIMQPGEGRVYASERITPLSYL